MVMASHFGSSSLFTKRSAKMYEIFEQLLQEHGVTTADVCKATGIGQSTMSNWKSRRNLISGKNARLIADYFGVSVDYLMSGKEPSSDFLYSDENADFLIEVQRKAHNLDFVKRMTMYMGLSDADRKSVDDMIEFLYNKEKNEEAD